MERAFNDLINSESYRSGSARKPLILIAGRPAAAEAIAEALDSIREHCQVAGSLEDATSKLESLPAACLIDVTSWNSGWVLLKRIRAQGALAETPVFVFSTKKVPLKRRQAMKIFRVDYWISKPFNSTTIRRQVANAILRNALKRGTLYGCIAS